MAWVYICGYMHRDDCLCAYVSMLAYLRICSVRVSTCTCAVYLKCMFVCIHVYVYIRTCWLSVMCVVCACDATVL